MLRNNYFGETKTHYKLYKCGKNWAVMGISLFSLGLGMLVTSQPVSADVTATSTSSSAVRTDAISASSSSAAKAETTSASSSSAAKAETAAITTAGVANADSQTSAEVTADSTSTSQVVTNNSNNQNNTAQPAGNSTSTTQSTNQANSQISNKYLIKDNSTNLPHAL